MHLLSTEVFSCVTCKLAKAVFSAVTVYSTPVFPSSHWSAAPLIVTSANWPSSVWKIEARRHPISFRPVLLDWIRSDKTGCMGLINLCTFCYRFYLSFTGFSQLTEHLLQVQSSFHWATVVMYSLWNLWLPVQTCKHPCWLRWLFSTSYCIFSC